MGKHSIPMSDEHKNKIRIAVKKYSDTLEYRKPINGKLVCSKCGEEKTIDHFYKSKSNRSGFMSHCKKCGHEACRISFQRNKKKYYKTAKTFRESHPRWAWANDTLKAHRKRGFNVIVSLKELTKIAEDTDHCFLCGTKLRYRGEFGKMIPSSASWDRLYNEDEMRMDNTAILCSMCNRTKGERPLNQFIEYCKMIADKFVGSPNKGGA